MFKNFFRFFDEYKKASEYFVKPKIKCYFGLWKKYHGLPVWRRGLVIRFGKYGQYIDESDTHYFCGWAKHQIWKDDFLKTCSRFGRWWRGFIRPTYQLPMWLSFYYSNRDIMWKTKYDEYVYEHPGQFCIVVFGICFALYTTIPITHIDNLLAYSDNIYSSPDAYWQTLLEYNYRDKGLSADERFKEALKYNICSTKKYTLFEKQKRDTIWEEIKKFKYDTDEYKALMKKLENYYGINLFWLECRPEYLTERGKQLWNEVNEELKNNKKYIKGYWLDN